MCRVRGAARPPDRSLPPHIRPVQVGGARLSAWVVTSKSLLQGYHAGTSHCLMILFDSLVVADNTSLVTVQAGAQIKPGMSNSLDQEVASERASV